MLEYEFAFLIMVGPLSVSTAFPVSPGRANLHLHGDKLNFGRRQIL
jgi:hypothetical protein